MFKTKGDHMVAKILFEVVKFAGTALIITTIVDVFLLGVICPHFAGKTKHSEFFVSPRTETVKASAGSFFEYQQQGGCAGFSSAFVLRHLGIQASGDEAFKEVPHQMRGGAGVPKSIPGFFTKKGIKMTACTGNLSALKNEIARGNPVIVVIRSFVGKNDLHFACITGYDENNIYFADSIESWVNVDLNNNDKIYYNRAVSTSEFKKLWNTSMLKMPLYRNMFFVMK